MCLVQHFLVELVSLVPAIHCQPQMSFRYNVIALFFPLEKQKSICCWSPNLDVCLLFYLLWDD